MHLYIEQLMVSGPNKLSFKTKPIPVHVPDNTVALTQHPTIWNLNKETNLLMTETASERIQKGETTKDHYKPVAWEKRNAE